MFIRSYFLPEFESKLAFTNKILKYQKTCNFISRVLYIDSGGESYMVPYLTRAYKCLMKTFTILAHVYDED